MMKKLLSIFCAFVLVFSAAACSAKETQPQREKNDAAPEEQGQAPGQAPQEENKTEQQETSVPEKEIEETTSPENLIEEAEGPVPEFLTPEQQTLYRRAKTAFMEFTYNNTGFGSTEEGERVYEYYSLCNGSITTWAGFEAAMCALFTPEYYQDLNDSEGFEIFKEYQGLLCFSGGARGGNVTFMGDETFELISQTQEEIQFNVVANYSNPIKLEDGTWGFDEENITQEKQLLVMKNTENGWRFSQFALAF